VALPPISLPKLPSLPSVLQKILSPGQPPDTANLTQLLNYLLGR
jgi:hypothetical protein